MFKYSYFLECLVCNSMLDTNFLFSYQIVQSVDSKIAGALRNRQLDTSKLRVIDIATKVIPSVLDEAKSDPINPDLITNRTVGMVSVES